MLRTTAFPKLAALALLAVAGLAQAQKSPSSAPPKLERIEEGSDTPITVTPPKASERKITEKRENGVVTEVKVKSGKSSYIMKPNVPAGNAVPGDAQSSAIRAPQWQVMEFDLGGKKKKTDKEDVDAGTVPPPPPPTK
ncbi:MAG: hypothetical protein V4508_00390 [Pseudomonadota bacterium]